MRAFVLFVIIVGLGGWFFYHKQPNTQPEPAQSQASAVVKSTPAPVLTPAPRGQASEHNWMKRALDRAADVRDQTRRQTNESQEP
jgi:hypothetical protein